MLEDDLGLADFQLYLLKAMDPPESLRTAALADLGSSKQDMFAKFDNVHQALWVLDGGVASNILPMLDQVRVPGSHPEGSVAFSLPIWKEFLYIVSFDSTGRVFSTTEFSRRDGRETDLVVRPWEILESELPEMFDRIEEFETWGPSYRVLTARHLESGEVFRLRFGFGLLQAVISRGDQSR
ncbi:hypothetical protein [Nocardia sp. NPDC050710]|uniref:hypothetical protein n=1 Tax=Nocardia sp. NPDC050710 TaxID=3157220 RepID=UPI0033C61689